MRIFRLLAFVTISVFLLCTIAPSVVNSGKKPSEGCVKSKITGDMAGMTKINGRETYCWNGTKEVRIQDQKVTTMGMTQVTHTATYTDFSEGGTIYVVDLSTDPPTGTRTENPMIKSLQESRGKIIGKGKVLGKKCDIWEISNMGTKTWIWNWINLKTVTSMGMIITTEATEILKKCDKKTVLKPNIKYVPMEEKTKGIEGLGDMMKQFQSK